MVVAVVLAGGLARRMGGGDKALVTLAGRPMLAHVLERVGPLVSAVAINANGDAGRFAGFGLPVLADTVGGFVGPLAGILAGMRWAASIGAGTLLSVPTDTPFLPEDLVVRLEGARAEAGVPLACAASGGWTHPVVGLWDVSLADALEAALRGGERKIDAWTAGVGVAHATWTGGDDPFANVNTPAELAEAEVRYGSTRA